MSGAPTLTNRADAKSGLTVMIVGASSRNVITRVGSNAPASSDVEGQTLSASIVSGTTRRNSDAGKLSGTPRIASLANTSTGLTVMVVGTSSGDVITSVSKCAPAGSGLEGNANTTVIVSETTRRNDNACTLSDTPHRSSWA